MKEQYTVLNIPYSTWKCYLNLSCSLLNINRYDEVYTIVLELMEMTRLITNDEKSVQASLVHFTDTYLVYNMKFVFQLPMKLNFC